MTVSVGLYFRQFSKLSYYCYRAKFFGTLSVSTVCESDHRFYAKGVNTLIIYKYCKSVNTALIFISEKQYQANLAFDIKNTSVTFLQNQRESWLNMHMKSTITNSSFFYHRF